MPVGFFQGVDFSVFVEERYSNLKGIKIKWTTSF